MIKMENDQLEKMVKNIFKIKLSLMVLGFLFIGDVKAQKDTLSIAHITDLHMIFSQNAHIEEMMKYRQKKGYHLGVSHFKEFMETVPKQTNSDLVVATGDMIDFFEAEIDDGSMLDIQIRQFAKLLDEYEQSILFTMGNHGTFSFEWDEKLDYKLLHDQYDSERARALWIKNIDSFKNGTYFSKKVKVGKTSYRLIFLDDSFYEFDSGDDTDVPYIDKSQEYWLRQELKASDNDVEIIFMHIPFSTEVAKNNTLYNVLKKFPSLKLVVAGHHHKSIIKQFSQNNDGNFFQVQTAPLVDSIDNWRSIHLTEEKILISETGKSNKQEEVIEVR